LLPSKSLARFVTRIEGMERIWPQNLASLRVFRPQRKFSVTGATARHHTKDTKVIEICAFTTEDTEGTENRYSHGFTRIFTD
jgi:hypothetical protein